MHLSDLHLGKSIHEFSLIDDQEYILCKILDCVDSEKPDCVFIAGDIFDKSVASTDALHLFDGFLVSLSGKNIQIFVTSGNHDSVDRLSFCARLIAANGIYISPSYENNIAKNTITDEYGDIDIYLLPFLKPIFIKKYFPNEKIETWTDAIKIAVKNIEINPKNRNILLAHQFVTGAIRCESEEINIGGADNIDASVFDDFDYVALGHIHGPQNMGRKTVRYCGSPLKYSFSESNHKKSITIVEMKEKGITNITEHPLIPKRDMCEIKGAYNELMARDYYSHLNLENYYHITLTDEDDQSDAIAKLRVNYKNLMRLDYDNRRTQGEHDFFRSIDAKKFTPLEVFEKFYAEQNNRELTALQKDYLKTLIEQVWSDKS